MITQQTASYLLKRMHAAVFGKGEAEDDVEKACRDWLRTEHNQNPHPFRIFQSDDDVVKAFHRRSRDVTYRAYVERYEKKRSWNDMLIQLRKVSHAESQSILVTNFHEALVNSNLSSTLKAHLRLQFRLFAFYTMDNEARDFSRADAVSNEDLDALLLKIQELMAQIRPHAVRLVDSWKIPDFLLDSALGRSDGNVYEDLFHRAHRLNPLNEVTFNPYYQDEEIVMGDQDSLKKLLAKL